MKKTAIIILGVVMLSVMGCEEKQDSNKSGELVETEQNPNLTPLQIVNERMRLYNEHNFEAFIKLYNEDVKVYTYPDKLMGTGSDRLASIFKSDFEKKSVNVKIINQISNGSYVINHEIVTHKDKETKYVSIYEVRDGLITSVSFVREF
jgi:hypothetical protein